MEVEGGRGDDVLGVDTFGDEAAIFIAEVEGQVHVFVELGADAGDAVDNVVATEIGDRRLVEGGVLEAYIVGDVLLDFQTKAETADFGVEALTVFEEVFGVVEHVSTADGVVVFRAPEDAVFHTGEEAVLVLETFEFVVQIGCRQEGRPAVVLPKVEFDVGGETHIVFLVVFLTINDGVVGVESQKAVVAFDASVVVEGDGVDVTGFQFAAKTEFVGPFALCRNCGHAGKHQHDR